MMKSLPFLTGKVARVGGPRGAALLDEQATGCRAFYFCVNLITEDLGNSRRVQNKATKIVQDFKKMKGGERTATERQWP